jgi:hypothetical protein
MAQYPAAVPTFTNPTGTQFLGVSTPPHSTQHSLLNNELGAALATLGVNPQGTGATVVARLDTADGKIAVASSNAAVALTTATAANALAITATSAAAAALSTATAASVVAIAASSNAAVALSTAQAAIPKSIGTTKGQLIVFTGSATPVVLSASTDGTALVCDTAAASGFKFAAVSGTGASATRFVIGATVPTTSGDAVVAISTITAPYSVLVNLYNPTGTMIIPDSIIATATQFTVNLYSYLSTGTLSGTYGGVYIV